MYEEEFCELLFYHLAAVPAEEISLFEGGQIVSRLTPASFLPSSPDGFLNCWTHLHGGQNGEKMTAYF